MMPGSTRVHFQLGATFAIMGRLDAAIPELELAASEGGHNSRVEAYLGYAYAAVGRTQDAHAMLQELESHRRDQHVSSFGIALIHDALGQKAPALAAPHSAPATSAPLNSHRWRSIQRSRRLPPNRHSSP